MNVFSNALTNKETKIIKKWNKITYSMTMIICVPRLDEIRHTVEIEDLQPSTGYTARVAGGNQADLSVFSPPVRFTTTEEGN